MPNTKEPRADTEDYRKVKTKKAPSIFSEPNDLSSALDNLDAYDQWSQTDEVFQNPDGGNLIVVKHEPYADAEKAKKVKKKAKKAETPFAETKTVHNLDLTELMELLKDSDAYSDYLGLGDVDYDDFDTDEFPMDDRTAALHQVADDVQEHMDKLDSSLDTRAPKPAELTRAPKPAEPTPLTTAKQKWLRAFLQTPHRLKEIVANDEVKKNSVNLPPFSRSRSINSMPH